MDRDSLILYAKAEELLFQTYPTFNNYPHSEKNGLTAIMKKLFFRLLEEVGQAKMTTARSHRMAHLRAAAGFLQNLVTAFRLSRERRYISRGFFEQVDLKITEIKKILFGFMKSNAQNRQVP
ncbi:four helix bundle protein [uncultured Halomonas sp.]|uniref:four helix bundle protein n=1 Tax=uncultured Halomonas sp. TaxID=173971 RepID=UPI0026366B04|nr:four helix bundle protein [uncultured Halomonas sp.]